MTTSKNPLKSPEPASNVCLVVAVAGFMLLGATALVAEPFLSSERRAEIRTAMKTVCIPNCSKIGS